MQETSTFRIPADRSAFYARMLDIMEHDIAPMTAGGVASGNKVFGAALLRKSDWSLVIAETNNETDNPLWHGEMHCLKRFFELEQRPGTDELVFLSTHEPCSLCLSAITWAGFDNFFYFFSHQDSRDSFAIPHDLRILSEVFRLKDGEYNRSNAYWSSWNIRQEIARLYEPDRSRLSAQSERLDGLYGQFSKTYQGSKEGSDIPLS